MSLVASLRHSSLARTVLGGPIALRRQLTRWRTQSASDVLERLQQLVTDDVCIAADEFSGRFYLPTTSHLLHRLLRDGRYEPELVALFREHLNPDRDVIDVGANIGFFSVLAGQLVRKGRVLAIEPTANAHSRLVRNLELNRVTDKVTVEQLLVGDADADVTMNVVSGLEEYSSIGEIVHPSAVGREVRQEVIRCETLDTIVERHQLKPGIIKIDVEGAEGGVFGGALRTLKDHRPIVIAEFSRLLLEANGADPDQILNQLKELGYEVADPFNPGVSPGTIYSADLIAVPR